MCLTMPRRVDDAFLQSMLKDGMRPGGGMTLGAGLVDERKKVWAALFTGTHLLSKVSGYDGKFEVTKRTWSFN